MSTIHVIWSTRHKIDISWWKYENQSTFKLNADIILIILQAIWVGGAPRATG